MKQTSADEFRYLFMPQATSADIVHVYGKASSSRPSHQSDGQALLSEVRQLRWQNFELLSATHLHETRVAMRHSDDVIAFLLPSDGHVEVSLRSRRTLSTTGAVAVPRSHCRTITLEPRKRQIRLSIPSSRFHQHIKAIHGQAFGTPILFEETPKLDVRMLDYLVSLIDILFQDVENARVGPGLLSKRIEALEICLLAVWPNSLWPENADSTACIAPRHVRAAIGMIRADPFAQLSIPALTGLCNVSVRTLQYGFRQFTSLSISEFITQARLSTIHARASDRKYIEAIKGRIGVKPFGKLSLDYKIRYGRSIGGR
ncbi:hypothetical protein [Rhizobium sp. SG2393]|uniref:AraC-like ligand-binding domain-containing protein n=1 Tax=Rhizobium sp. SG2393 TaxID=3276279 RepID=UPI00366FF635